ncbi:NAD(P)-dependent alcohol dehydrogenase [Streptomyces antimycoticus]|uniref:NAD(P)-dependent alcohol dehydrogenase n=1 Tax=Streptomyces antimycoticus TaxID=68175 RepID=UPI00342FCE67
MRVSAAVVDGLHGRFDVRDVEIDDPGPGEVLVRIAASGICHTDAATRDGNLPFPLPGVLGHEGAGTVVAVGEGVSEVREGQAVVIGWPWCGRCRHCRAGEHRYCQSVFALASSGGRQDGSSALRDLTGERLSSHFFGQSSFATHSVTYESSLVPVPDGLPIGLLGPLACGLATGAGAIFYTVRPSPGASVAVYGVGAVGLAAIMACVNTTATTIIAVDRHESRLALAKQLGATHIVNTTQEDPVRALHDICDGPADYALDCTGTVSGARQAADSVGMLGTCVLVGGTSAGAELNLDHGSTLRGKSIVGVLGGGGRSRELIGALMDLYAQGRFPFDRLIEPFPLDRIEDALEASARGEVIKPVLTMPG